MSSEASASPLLPSLTRDNAPREAETFKAAFSALAGQPLAPEPELDNTLLVRKFAAGECVFAAGSMDLQVHVVLEGFLTLKYETADGACWVKGFISPGFPFACVACLDGKPAPFSAFAGSSARIASVPFPVLERLARESTGWQVATQGAFKAYGQRKEQREKEFLVLSAEQRYLEFLREMPEIARRLKQHEVASYIRVTPVALSRIRRRLGLIAAGKKSS